MSFLMEHQPEVLGLLFAISEVLALIPSIKANGIFDAIQKGIKFLYDKAMASKQ